VAPALCRPYALGTALDQGYSAAVTATPAFTAFSSMYSAIFSHFRSSRTQWS